MIIAILTVLSSAFSLINTLVEKYASAKHVPTLRRGTAGMKKYFEGMTVEQMAKAERRRQRKLLDDENG